MLSVSVCAPCDGTTTPLAPLRVCCQSPPPQPQPICFESVQRLLPHCLGRPISSPHTPQGRWLQLLWAYSRSPPVADAPVAGAGSAVCTRCRRHRRLGVVPVITADTAARGQHPTPSLILTSLIPPLPSPSTVCNLPRPLVMRPNYASSRWS